jgi:nucleotide-binding universal stress UspA family protein
MQESNSPAVVVGVDGSQAAIEAVRWAVVEAVSRAAPLRLVAAIPQQVEPAPYASVGNFRMEREYAEAALRRATAAVRAASAAPERIETEVLLGDPATVLIAESRDAVMVCVGSVGIGRVARALLGSTVAEVADGAYCSVAIIRTRPSQLRPDSDVIAVAVSDSPDNDGIVEQAIKEAQLRDLPVLAVGAWRADLGEMPYDELDRRVAEWEERYPDVHFHVVATRSGMVGFLSASDRRIQLAVIGGGDIDEVTGLLGPQSHYFFGHAECSVLITRPAHVI